jgi:hypothetical protein
MAAEWGGRGVRVNTDADIIRSGADGGWPADASSDSLRRKGR